MACLLAGRRMADLGDCSSGSEWWWGGIDQAVPWPTGPDPCHQLFMCLLPWLASLQAR